MSAKEIQEKLKRRLRRKIHIRKQLSGSPLRPRMTVYKSNRNLYVQVIDDSQGKTLVSISSKDKALGPIKNCVADAAKLGEALGSRMKESKIEAAVFDRNGYKYHGIVRAIADGARKAGITL